MVRAIAVAALLGISFPAPVSAQQCSAADKAALEAFDKAWGDASQRGDRAFLESALAPGFTSLGITGSTDRATTIANAMASAERNRTNPQTPGISDYYSISCTSNSATIAHRTWTPVAAGSTNPQNYGRVIHFLERRGNSWQAVSSVAHGLQDGAVLGYMEREWNDAWMKRDIGWMERNYAPFAFEVSSRTGKLENKAQSIESAKSDKTVLESLELSDLAMRVDGNVAVVTGVNHVKGKDEVGKPFDRRVRFTDTFVKRDGRWMVWATQGTDIK